MALERSIPLLASPMISRRPHMLAARVGSSLAAIWRLSSTQAYSGGCRWARSRAFLATEVTPIGAFARNQPGRGQLLPATARGKPPPLPVNPAQTLAQNGATPSSLATPPDRFPAAAVRYLWIAGPVPGRSEALVAPDAHPLKDTSQRHFPHLPTYLLPPNALFQPPTPCTFYRTEPRLYQYPSAVAPHSTLRDAK